MCARWFPATYQHAITLFLQQPDEMLDTGFSLELQNMALAQGDETQQRGFLLSDEVQKFMEEAAAALMVTSLPAERAAAEVKRHESHNVSLLSSVSMDLLCRRFVSWQQGQRRSNGTRVVMSLSSAVCPGTCSAGDS